MDKLNELLKKQAQELVLTPSPSVWMNVEADIARRERRRRWFFWLFLLVFFGCGIILYTVFAEKSRPQANRQSSSSLIANNKPEHKAAVDIEPVKNISSKTKPATLSQPAIDGDQKADVQRTGDIIEPELISRVSVEPVTRIEKGQPRAFTREPTERSVHQPSVQPVAMKMPEKDEIPRVQPAIARVSVEPVTRIEKGQPRAFTREPTERSVHRPSTQPVVMKIPEKDEMSTLQPAIPVAVRPVSIVAGNTRAAVTSGSHTPKEMRPLLKENPAVLPLKSTSSFTKNTAAQPVRTIEQPTIKDPVFQSKPISQAAIVPDVKVDDTVLQDEIVQKPALPTSLIPANTVPVIFPLKIKKACWSFTASMAPSLNFSKVEEDNKDLTFIAQARSSSKKLVSMNFNIAAWYQVSPRFEVYSGLGIRSLGERMRAAQNIYGVDSGLVTNNNKHVVVRRTLIKGDSSDLITNRFSYLEIPLGLRFRLIARKQWGVYINADIAASYLVSAKGYYYNYTARNYLSMNNDRLKNWLLAYGAGVSLQYNLRKNIGIECMPYFRNYPSSVYKPDKQNKVSQYFQQSGLQFSVRYYPGDLRRK